VSSNAATYPPDPWYPYATAKREAEAVVRGGTVPFAIVRPTIVLGDGSPIMSRLRALASGPVVTVIGDGTTRVQPVDVADVAAALARMLERRTFDGVTRAFGGPEVLSIEDLLLRMRRASGKPAARVVRVPYALLRGGLVTLEVLTGGLAPLSAGQLGIFQHDGTAEASPLWNEMRPSLRSVEQMIAPVTRD
jgi:NADH dehydrogenase